MSRRADDVHDFSEEFLDNKKYMNTEQLITEAEREINSDSFKTNPKFRALINRMNDAFITNYEYRNPSADQVRRAKRVIEIAKNKLERQSRAGVKTRKMKTKKRKTIRRKRR